MLLWAIDANRELGSCSLESGNSGYYRAKNDNFMQDEKSSGTSGSSFMEWSLRTGVCGL